MIKNAKLISRIVSIIFVISIVLFVAGCSNKDNAPAKTQSSNAPAKKFTLKIGSNAVQTHPECQYAYKLAELVKEKTNGNVEIEVYPSAQLGDHKERLEGLKMGTIDMSIVDIGYAAAITDKALDILGSPYIFRDIQHQANAFAGQLGQKVTEKLEKNTGVIVLQYSEQGPRHITNSQKPIKAPENLKGLKLRVPDSKASIDALTAMGANAAPLPFSELYMALQQKVVDGQENPVSNIFGSKFYEVQKYLSLSAHQRLENVVLFSKVNWDKIPKEYQDIIRKSSEEANEFYREAIIKDETDLIDQLKQKGMEVNEVDQEAFRQAVKPMVEKNAEALGDTAKEFLKIIEETK